MKKTTLLLSLVLLAGLAVGSAGQTQGGLAELNVQKIVLDPPSAVTRGEDVEVYARITNTGGRSAEHFTVGFYYRPAREGEPWILLGTVEEEHLGPSQQDFLEATYEFSTLDMELGTYEIRAVADVWNQIPEVDELNNELRTSMILVASTLGLPELQPIGLTFAQTGTSDMDPWTITLTVENSGQYALSSFDVRFLLDGEPLSLPIQPDPPFIPDTGATTSITARLDPHGLDLSPGTYLVTGVVDSSEQVSEQDEGNNAISASLSIQTVELHPESLRFDRPVVRLDEEVRVTSQIANVGNGLAKNVRVDFFINHLRFGTAGIDQLGVTPKEVSVTLDADKLGLKDAPKEYEIRVVVDPDNTLSESDEANNELIRTLTILEPMPKKPEIHPESIELTPASPAEQGREDTVTVTSVIRNTGRTDAVGFDVKFHYRVKGGLLWTDLLCPDVVSCSELTLPAGAQVRLVGTLPISELDLQAGIYEIRVVADASGSIGELDEGNNELVTTLTLLASRRPDLTVTIDRIEPAYAVQKGQTARVFATVTNVGEQPAEASILRFSYCKLAEVVTTTAQQGTCVAGFETRAVLPDAEIPTPPLGIGESTTIQVNIETAHMAQPGQYAIQATVDPYDWIKERDEIHGVAANNVAAGSLTVLGPDLFAVPDSLRADPSGTIDQNVTDRVDLELTVLNGGLEAAGAFAVGFELLRVVDGVLETVSGRDCCDTDYACADPTQFGIVSLPGIGAGAQQRVSCALDLSRDRLPAGQYIVRAHIDSKNEVAEHIEINNEIEIPLTIIGGPPSGGGTVGSDLSVDVASGRAKLYQIAAYGLITNVGSTSSGPFSLEILVTLPSGRLLRSVEVASPGLNAGEQITVGVQFLQGTDFPDVLAVGDSIDVTVRLFGNDGNVANNTASTTLHVREQRR